MGTTVTKAAKPAKSEQSEKATTQRREKQKLAKRNIDNQDLSLIITAIDDNFQIECPTDLLLSTVTRAYEATTVYDKGERVWSHRRDNSCVFIIIDGACVILTEVEASETHPVLDKIPLIYFKELDIFGLTPTHVEGTSYFCQAEILALERCRVAALTADPLRHLIKKHGENSKDTLGRIQNFFMRTDSDPLRESLTLFLCDELVTTLCFGSWNVDHLCRLLDTYRVWLVPSGATLFAEGESPENIFILFRGSLRMSVPDKHWSSDFGTYKHPLTVAEENYFAERPYDFTLKVVEPSIMLPVSCHHLTDLVHDVIRESSHNPDGSETVLNLKEYAMKWEHLELGKSEIEQKYHHFLHYEILLHELQELPPFMARRPAYLLDMLLVSELRQINPSQLIADHKVHSASSWIITLHGDAVYESGAETITISAVSLFTAPRKGVVYTFYADTTCIVLFVDPEVVEAMKEGAHRVGGSITRATRRRTTIASSPSGSWWSNVSPGTASSSPPSETSADDVYEAKKTS